MRKKTMRAMLIFLSVLVVIQAGCTSNDEEVAVQPGPEGSEVWEFTTLTATVEAIDPLQREITLRGPLDNTATFAVDRRVQRLDEIEPGDEVVVGYYASLATEIREPTAEERESPLTVVEGTTTASPGTAPGAGGLRQIKAVVTIEAMDRAAQTVTVKGPLGRYLTVRVAEPARLGRVRLGDTVVVTYTEALAVSIEKAR